MKYRQAEPVQRGHAFAIVDEVDSVLIDEARTPLVIAGESENSSDLYLLVDAIVAQLLPEDSEVDIERRTAILRHLVKQENRSSNFGVISSFLSRTRFEGAARDRIHADLDSLKQYGLITDEWLDGGMRLATVTERGDDAARGRIKDIAVIDVSFWEP